MLFFPGYAGTRHCLHEAVALGLTVWMLYVADRLLDARDKRGLLRERHLFHHRHRHMLLAGMAGCVPVLGLLVATLPAELRTGWLLLSVPLLAYAAVIHCWRVSRLPKESIVAAFFALATAMPAFTQQPRTYAAPAQAVLFGGLCWMNCIAIARWEGVPLHDPGRTAKFPASHTPALSTAWGSRHLPAVGTLLIAAYAACAVFHAATKPYANFELACAFSASLLLLLDRVRKHIAATELRSLADAALLTPLLLRLLLR